jgi:hypothetical protein
MYFVTAQSMGVEPWKLRENYIRLRLGQLTETQLLNEYGPKALTKTQATTLLQLLKSQFHRQRMYTSAAFFYEDLDRTETRLAIADAVEAMRLTQSASNMDLTATFRADLVRVVSNQSGRSGAEILDEVLLWERQSHADVAPAEVA